MSTDDALQYTAKVMLGYIHAVSSEIRCIACDTVASELTDTCWRIGAYVIPLNGNPQTVFGPVCSLCEKREAAA